MNKIITFLTIALFIIPTYLLAAQSQNLESVLLEASSGGNTDMVRSFLDNGANIEIKNEVGATPLIFASAKGQKEVVALLLDKGANVNAKTTTGITPLMAAAAGGYPEIVKLLLAKGADVSAKDQQGRTAFSMAQASGDSQVADLLKPGQKSSVPEQTRVASPSTSYTPPSSAGPSDSSPADSESSSPTPDLSQGSDGSPAGQPGGLLNNPVIGSILNRVLGGQQSNPGNVAAIQNVNPGAQNQPPAQGANAQPAPAGQATTNVTKNPDGSTTIVNKNKSGTLVTNKDKSGVGTFTSFDTNGNKTTAGTLDGKGGGTETKFGPNGKEIETSTFGDNGKAISRTHFNSDGTPASVDTIDPKTSKVTTVQCNAPGSNCPQTTAHDLNAKQLKAGANTLKANTTPQGLTATKQNAKADVLKQIQGKSSGDAKVAKTTNPDGSTSTVIKHPNGSTTTVTKKPDGSMATETKKPDGSTTTVTKGKLGSSVTTTDKTGAARSTSFDSNGKKILSGTTNAKTGAQRSTSFDTNGKNKANTDALDRFKNKATLQNFTAGNQQTKEGFAKSQIPAGSNINGKAVPRIQSPSEFSQGNKHQPQNNLTKNFDAKSNSLNSNSSAGSQGTVKHQSQNFNAPAGGQLQKRNR